MTTLLLLELHRLGIALRLDGTELLFRPALRPLTRVVLRS